MMDYVWLIPLFPLIGFLINGLLGKRLSKNVVGTIGSLAVGLSFLLTVGIFLEFLQLPHGSRVVEKTVFTWISSGSFQAQAAFLIDPLSLVMLLVVSGVPRCCVWGTSDFFPVCLTGSFPHSHFRRRGIFIHCHA